MNGKFGLKGFILAKALGIGKQFKNYMTFYCCPFIVTVSTLYLDIYFFLYTKSIGTCFSLEGILDLILMFPGRVRVCFHFM